MIPSIRVRAHAKINTGLKILGTRSDGYHELRTVYQTISLHDTLKVSLATEPGIQVESNDASLPQGRGNLVYDACRLWRRARKYKGGIRVSLFKAIPAGAGLGGGSSDAAMVLLSLDRLAGYRRDPPAWLRESARLGSDVPLFLLGGRVLGCGRGEEVYPLQDLPPRHCLVAHPGFAVSTAAAFAAFDRLTARPDTGNINRFGVWSQFPLQGWGPAENDFERFVFAKWPELARVKDQFIRAGAEIVSLSGSGSALYAIFASARHLRQAAGCVPSGWSVFVTRTLSRAEYARRIFCRQ